MPKKKTVEDKIGRKKPKPCPKWSPNPVPAISKETPTALPSRDKKRLKKSYHQILSAKAPGVSEEGIRQFILKLGAHLTELINQSEKVLRAQKEIEAEWDRYEDFYDSINLGYATLSKEGMIIEADLACANTLRYEKSLLIGKSFSHFIDRDAQDKYYFFFQNLLETNAPQTCELKLKREDIEPLYVKLDCIVKKDADHAFYIVIAINDITERKKARDALKKSHKELLQQVEKHTISLKSINEQFILETEVLKRIVSGHHSHRELLETVIHNIPTAVNLIRGSDLRIELINPAYQAISPGKDMVGKTLDEIWPESQHNFEDLCRQVLATGETYHVTDELNMVQRFQGGPLEPAYFSWSLHRVNLPHGKGYGILTTARETTERKRAEDNLRNSEEKYRSLVQSTNDSIYLVDEDCNYLFMNIKHRNRLCLPSLRIEGTAYEAYHSKQETEAFKEKMKEVFESGSPLSYEYQSKRDENYFLRTLSPIKDGKKVKAVSVISKDITKQKQAELEAQINRLELAHLGRVATMGELTASLAHELSQPLTAVLSNAQTALRHIQRPPPRRWVKCKLFLRILLRTPGGRVYLLKTFAQFLKRIQ